MRIDSSKAGWRTGLLAAALGVLLLLPGKALADVTAFTGRNIVVGAGFNAGDTVDVTVLRGGVLMATSVGNPVDAGGNWNANHPGGNCFAPFTPEFLAGDEVRTLASSGGATTQIVQNATATTMTAGPGANQVTITGIARTPAGAPLAGSSIRAFPSSGLFSDGTRLVRSDRTGVFTDDGLGNVSVVFTLPTAADASSIINGGSSEVVWSNRAVPASVSIGVIPAAPAAPGCPAVAKMALTSFTPAAISLATAPAVTLAGFAPAGSAVSVTVTDSAGATRGPFAATAGAAGTFSLVADLSGLASGVLTGSMSATPPGALAAIPGASATASLDGVAPTFTAITLNGGAAFTTTPLVSVAVTAADPAPSTGLFVALAADPLGLATAARVPFAASFPFTVGPAGTVCARVTDGAGNAAADLCATIIVDAAGPTFTAQTPAAGAAVTAPLGSALVTAADPNGLAAASLTATVDAAAAPAALSVAGVVTVSPAGGFAVGAHTVVVSLADTAGNLSTSTWTFRVNAAGLPPPPPPPGTVAFTDAFNRVGALGTAWRVPAGGYSCDGANAVSSVPTWGEARVNGVSLGNVTVVARLKAPVTGTVGVKARIPALAPNSDYSVYLANNGVVSLRRKNAGVDTVLATKATTAAQTAFHNLTVSVTGTTAVTITVALDGVTVISFVDSSAARLAGAGLVGIAGRDTARFDSFTAGTP